MTCIFDKEKLRVFLQDFHTLTKCTISIWDADFNQIMFYPPNMCGLCRQIKSTSSGKKKCLESDIHALKIASKLRKPYTFTCHAGLVDTAIAVFYADEIIAYIMFGQINDSEKILCDIEKTKKIYQKYGFNVEEIEDLYQEIPVLDNSQINASAHFLQMCTSYLYLHQMIKIEKNELAFSIDRFIVDNINKDISVGDICETFRISKNKLYQVSHKFFNTTIKNYIIRKRLDAAKHYLTTSDLPINEISSKVGFTDYNYFIRIFKSKIGYTPLSYRKEFPFNLS